MFVSANCRAMAGIFGASGGVAGWVAGDGAATPAMTQTRLATSCFVRRMIGSHLRCGRMRGRRWLGGGIGAVLLKALDTDDGDLYEGGRDGVWCGDVVG